jgi:L-asparaginase
MKENGLAPGITTGEIQKELHMVAPNIDLEMRDVLALDSANIFPEDWALLAEHIASARSDFDGIVLIHGTDTMAYTSSMLSFMLRNINIPIVLTGSQLSIADPVADAMENLRCAIHMAVKGFPGVYIAFNRKIILGCRASKVRSLSFDAYDSINYPLIGQISSLGLQIRDKLIPSKTGIFTLKNHYSDKVFMLKMFPGMDSSVVKFLAKKGYRGLYIEAFGMGGLPFLRNDFISTIADVIRQEDMTVLIGTQCRYEGSSLEIYETGRRALDAGCLQARDMTSEAALTKLMWVLGKTEDPMEIRDYFSTCLCQEVTIPR